MQRRRAWRYLSHSLVAKIAKVKLWGLALQHICYIAHGKCMCEALTWGIFTCVKSSYEHPGTTTASCSGCILYTLLVLHTIQDGAQLP